VLAVFGSNFDIKHVPHTKHVVKRVMRAPTEHFLQDSRK